jgi:hypothetical protein
VATFACDAPLEVSFDPTVGANKFTKTSTLRILRPAEVPPEAVWSNERKCWTWYQGDKLWEVAPILIWGDDR